MSTPVVSIIIVNYNTQNLLRNCLDSLQSQIKGLPFEIIIVDNASVDGSPAMVKAEFPQAKLIQNNLNLGFGAANNLGFEASQGSYLMLFNSDAVLLEDTASQLVKFLEEHPEVGVVGPAVLLPDGRPQSRIFGSLPTVRTILNESLQLNVLFPKVMLLAGLHHHGPVGQICETGWISGVCMMFRREAYEEIGGFDPSYFLYAEDMDLCQRLRKHEWRVFHLNAYPIRHFGGGSSPDERTIVKNSLLQQRNFLKLLRSSMNEAEYFLAKAFLALGLILRLNFGVIRAIRGDRLLFQASRLRLVDLFGVGKIGSGVQE